MNKPNVLICDDDLIFQTHLKQALKVEFLCTSAKNGDEAVAIVKNHAIDVLLLDIHMRDAQEGFRYIPKLIEADPDLTIVMTSSRKDFHAVQEAMRLGAADYVAKDSDPDELIHVLKQVLVRRQLLQRTRQHCFETLSQQRQNVLVGVSPQIQLLKRTIEKVRNSRANVVIYGETGTGKELVARQLRASSQDASGETLAPFLAIDSATIQDSMAESLLFGHEKGAFTGAEKTTKGLFEEAHGGIVYFDEVANMPLSIQAKLLRVLQEKEVTRLGSSKVLKLDFRVICATNQDLEECVKNGQFKDDLLQRLNVIPIFLTPLRERPEDLEPLIEHFTKKQTRAKLRLDSSPQPLRFSESVMKVLREYSWPGNVRELGNLIAFLSTMAESEVIQVSDLPPKFWNGRNHAATSTRASRSPLSFHEKLSTFERDLLHEEYLKYQGNISQLAHSLNLDRSHLYLKLKTLGIHQSKPSKTGKIL